MKRHEVNKTMTDEAFKGFSVFSPGWRPVGSWSGKARWHTAQTGTRR